MVAVEDPILPHKHGANAVKIPMTLYSMMVLSLLVIVACGGADDTPTSVPSPSPTPTKETQPTTGLSPTPTRPASTSTSAPTATPTAPRPTTIPTATPTQEPVGTVVDADILDFRHQDLEISAGTTVVWTNRDSVGHTSSSIDGVWESGSMGLETTFSFTFAAPGTHNYLCKIHPSMTATVTVTG